MILMCDYCNKTIGVSIGNVDLSKAKVFCSDVCKTEYEKGKPVR